MLRDICYTKAHSMYGEELPSIVKERLDRELNSIISNGYAVMNIKPVFYQLLAADRTMR